jgi:hypothetical protein
LEKLGHGFERNIEGQYLWFRPSRDALPNDNPLTHMSE